MNAQPVKKSVASAAPGAGRRRDQQGRGVTMDVPSDVDVFSGQLFCDAHIYSVFNGAATLPLVRTMASHPPLSLSSAAAGKRS